MDDYSRLVSAVKSFRRLPSVVVALCIVSSIVAWSSTCATIIATSIILSVASAAGLLAGVFWVFWQTIKRTKLDDLLDQLEEDQAKKEVIAQTYAKEKETTR
jgi:peroxiredoxin family protein